MPFGELVLPGEDRTRRAFFGDKTISKPRCVELCWTDQRVHEKIKPPQTNFRWSRGAFVN